MTTLGLNTLLARSIDMGDVYEVESSAFEPFLELWMNAPDPRSGDLFRHFRGGLYRVLEIETATQDWAEDDCVNGITLTSSVITGEAMVIYEALSEGHKYGRSLVSWQEIVAVPRFGKVGDEEARG